MIDKIVTALDHLNSIKAQIQARASIEDARTKDPECSIWDIEQADLAIEVWLECLKIIDNEISAVGFEND